MLISPDLAKAFNQQIGHEFGASLQYLSIAAHFYQRSLTLLAKLFQEQAEEEKQHAMKFIKYLQARKAGCISRQFPRRSRRSPRRRMRSRPH